MESVSLSRSTAAPPDAVQEAILDLEPFMLGAGFDDVTVTDPVFEDGRAIDGTIVIGNSVGLFRIELTLAIVDRPGTVLTYEQVDGIFEAMTTEYELESVPDSTEVSVRTDFALDAAFVGPIFDATVIKRQRKREIEQQFDYLAEHCD